MVTYFDGPLPIKSHGFWMTWFSEITWQTRAIISPLPQLATKFGRMVTYLEGLLTVSYLTFWSSGLVKSRDKKTHYTSTTRLPMATKPGRIIIFLDEFIPVKSHDSLIMWHCYITWQNENHCMSNTTVPMETKLGRAVTCHEDLPVKTLREPSITWNCEVTWHNKYFISPLALDQ